MIHLNEDYKQIQDPTGVIGEDEPVFLLRAIDVCAPVAVRSYAQRLDTIGGDKAKVREALSWADKMESWLRQHASTAPKATPERKTWRIRLHIEIKEWKEGLAEDWAKAFPENFYILETAATVVRASVRVNVEAVTEAEAVTAAWETFDSFIPTHAVVNRLKAAVE